MYAYNHERVLAMCQVILGETLNVHLILDDPAGNSYMQVLIIHC